MIKSIYRFLLSNKRNKIIFDSKNIIDNRIQPFYGLVKLARKDSDAVMKTAK